MAMTERAWVPVTFGATPGFGRWSALDGRRCIRLISKRQGPKKAIALGTLGDGHDEAWRYSDIPNYVCDIARYEDM